MIRRYLANADKVHQHHHHQRYTSLNHTRHKIAKLLTRYAIPNVPAFLTVTTLLASMDLEPACAQQAFVHSWAHILTIEQGLMELRDLRKHRAREKRPVRSYSIRKL